jgi:peptidyl-prolyl cis-trans isomerase D
MLRKFRTHQKKILWILAIIIIPAFVLWGSLKDESQETVIKIAGRRISIAQLKEYGDTAEIYFAFFSNTADKKFTAQDKGLKAIEFLLLLWKADKEKIKVSDKEVVAAIKTIKSFSPEGKFNEFAYEHFLKRIKHQLNITPRFFEECVRNILTAKKLQEKYIKVKVSPGEVKGLYRKDNQKAKISYIFVPYDKFKNEVNATEQEIDQYYSRHKESFKEEAAVKIKYALVNQNSETAKKINDILPKIKSIEELKAKAIAEVKESGFIRINDPIEGIGWQPQIVKFAFSLPQKKLSKLDTNIGYILIEKQDEKPARVPPLAEVKTKIEDKIKLAKEKAKAKILCENILLKISRQGITDLAKIAAQEKIEHKETGYFKYYDYIEGLGLSEKVSKIVFSLKKGDIYRYSLALLKGAYIIQLKDVSIFDEKDFLQKRETYQNYLLQQKTAVEEMKFVSRLTNEAQLQYMNAPDSSPQ